MKKFKSWLLITTDYSPRRGGVARYYQGLADNLPKFNVLTSVASTEKETRVIRYSLFSNWLWPHWLPLLWLVPFYKLITRADLLAAGQILPIGTALWLMNQAFGWPYAVLVHGYDLGLIKKSGRKSWLARKILSQASLVVANSEFTKNLAVQLGVKIENMVVVYPCTNLKLVEVTPEKIKEFKEQNKVDQNLIILTTARLVKRKNVAAVIKAVGELGAEFPNLCYVVIGGGPELTQLKNLTREINAPVRFLGEINDDEVALWYRACDLFVMTPLADEVDIEGFGIVYLEAQAAGKAIIASAVGGVSEAVGEAGRLIKNDTKLVDTMRELLNNPSLREELGAKGRQRIINQFNWSSQIKKLNFDL